MQPTTRGTVARPLGHAAKGSTIATAVCGVLGLVGGVPPAVADSLAYLGRDNDRYRYRGLASDLVWEVGDTITLTSLDRVTGANQPSGFDMTFSTWSVTWSCNTQRLGLTWFSVYSWADPGQVEFGIQSENPNSGAITGPAYLPEPAMLLLFTAGVLALAGSLCRRGRVADVGQDWAA